MTPVTDVFIMSPATDVDHPQPAHYVICYRCVHYVTCYRSWPATACSLCHLYMLQMLFTQSVTDVDHPQPVHYVTCYSCCSLTACSWCHLYMLQMLFTHSLFLVSPVTDVEHTQPVHYVTCLCRRCCVWLLFTTPVWQRQVCGAQLYPWVYHSCGEQRYFLCGLPQSSVCHAVHKSVSELRYSGFDLVRSRMYLSVHSRGKRCSDLLHSEIVCSECLKSCSAVYIKSIQAYEQLSTYNMSNYLN